MEVLGHTVVRRGGNAVALGPARQRAVVAALALAGGRGLSVDALADLVWAGRPPADYVGTLHAYIARLRRILEPERSARSPATVLTTERSAYVLRLGDQPSDAEEFERSVAAATRALGGTGISDATDLADDDLTAITTDLDRALDSWRGEPYADLPPSSRVLTERARLEELRTVALEQRAAAALHLGQHVTLVAELEALTAAEPLRESLWAMRALALTRAGRQAEALEVLTTLRQVLDAELGLSPSSVIRDLQQRILRQDPALAWRRREASSAGGGVRERADQPEIVADTEPSTAGTPKAQKRRAASRPALPDWPMIGRGRELALLRTALERAAAGRVVAAAIGGEPGIGKSRLAAELANVALGQGWRVLAAHCQPDEGTPPMWPWRLILRALDRDLGAGAAPSPGADAHDGEQFRVWEGVVRDIQAAAEEKPLLVVLEDAHWADDATLRILRLLIESPVHVSLLIIATWRLAPGNPAGLQEVAAAVSRQHGVRIDLKGLPKPAVKRLLAELSVVPGSGEAARLHARTEGNPFFLVEYAQLASGSDLSDVLAQPIPPTAVMDVIQQRLGALPQESVAMLRHASVVGSEFDVNVLARATGSAMGEVLDQLMPAVAAGLIIERGIESFAFSHNLIRDTLYAALGATRAAAVHAAVAQLLDGRPDQVSEAAGHWAAAGQRHRRRAWQAAVAAARAAGALHAYDQAADWLARALRAHGADPDDTEAERFDILLRLANVSKWRADWREMARCVEEAVEIADRTDDLVGLGSAASLIAVDSLWPSATHGTGTGRIVAALHRVLREAPPGDSALRCRALLALASEGVATADLAERRRLCREGLAMARRLEDTRLVLSACQVSSLALIGPGTAPERVERAREAQACAHQLGRRYDHTVSGSLLAIALSELGDRDDLDGVLERTRRAALQLRLPFALSVLNSVEIPWLAMSGEFEEAHDLILQQEELVRRLATSEPPARLADARMVLALWLGDADGVDLRSGLAAIGPDGPSRAPFLGMLLVRVGRVGDAAPLLGQCHQALAEPDGLTSVISWAGAAEVAAALGDKRLAESAYERLSPLRGQNVCLASGWSLGPVDAFCALAAAALGDRHAGEQHARDARELMTSWRIPLCRNWFDDAFAKTSS